MHLDLVRALLALSMLIYASYRDIEERRVPNRVWYPFVAVALLIEGTALLVKASFIGYLLIFGAALCAGLFSLGGTRRERFFELLGRPPGTTVLALLLAVSLPLLGIFLSRELGSRELLRLATSFLAAIAFVAGVHLVEELMDRRLLGGADLKAVLVLALLIPTFPPWTFHRGVVGIPVVTFLTNALLLGLVYPFGLFLLNLVRGERRWKLMFLGTPRELAEVEAGTLVLERLSGSGSRRDAPGSVTATEELLRRFRELGYDEVWTTYLIPFMVLILAGFVAGVTFGDLYTELLEAFLS